MNTRPWCPPSSLRLPGLLALLVLLAPAAHASFLSADPVYLGYRIPEHRWSSWTATVDMGGSHTVSPYSGSGGEVRRGTVNGRLGTGGTWGYDSDPLQHVLRFSVDANGFRRSDDVTFEQAILSSSSQGRQRRLEERFSLGASIRSYPWASPVGLTFATDHALLLQQTFTSANRREVNPPLTYEYTTSQGIGQRDYQGAVSAGVGLGRVRDATPVYQARVLEQRLLRTGTLTRALSGEGRRKLAALFAMQGAFKYPHERSSKYFWREVERVLREDGVLSSGSLDAFDAFRISESIFGLVSRRTGGFIGPAITVVTTRTRTTNEYTYSDRALVADTVFYEYSSSFDQTTNDRSADVFTSIVAELHRPLSERWQLDASTVTGLSESGETLATTSSARGAWTVSDRWLGILRLEHQGSTQGRGNDRRLSNWDAILAAELYYFLEDAWAVRLRAGETQSHRPQGFSRFGSFSLGVTYVLSGFFEAPGLVEAMRLTPPVP